MSILQKAFDRPGVDYVEIRNNPYFNKYLYRATLQIYGLKRIVSKNESDTNAINKFNQWKNENFYDKKNCKVRIQGNNVSVYSNDLEILLSLNDCFYYNECFDYKSNVVITQLIHNPNYREVKYFVRQPKHQYRMYFKSRRVTPEIYDSLMSFIEEYKDTIYLSHPLKRALRNLSSIQNYYYFYGNEFYVDLDDEGSVTFILLKYDNLFSRVLKLEKLPEIKEKINTL